MTAQSRDTQILEKIQGYCNDIMFTHTEYAHDYHTFCTNPTYRNAIALCLMQIGELVKASVSGIYQLTYQYPLARHPGYAKCRCA